MVSGQSEFSMSSQSNGAQRPQLSYQRDEILPPWNPPRCLSPHQVSYFYGLPVPALLSFSPAGWQGKGLEFSHPSISKDFQTEDSIGLQTQNRGRRAGWTLGAAHQNGACRKLHSLIKHKRWSTLGSKSTETTASLCQDGGEGETGQLMPSVSLAKKVSVAQTLGSQKAGRSVVSAHRESFPEDIQQFPPQGSTVWSFSYPVIHSAKTLRKKCQK